MTIPLNSKESTSSRIPFQRASVQRRVESSSMQLSQCVSSWDLRLSRTSFLSVYRRRRVLCSASHGIFCKRESTILLDRANLCSDLRRLTVSCKRWKIFERWCWPFVVPPLGSCQKSLKSSSLKGRSCGLRNDAWVAGVACDDIVHPVFG